MAYRMLLPLHSLRVALLLFVFTLLANHAPLSHAAEQSFTIISTDQLKAMVDEKKTRSSSTVIPADEAIRHIAS